MKLNFELREKNPIIWIHVVIQVCFWKIEKKHKSNKQNGSQNK
jgi:hypothetical protein